MTVSSSRSSTGRRCLLAHGLSVAPQRACVVEADRELTFADVDRRADALVGALAAEGLRPGDRVALLAANELEYLEIQIAVQRAGLVFVPLNHRLASGELSWIVSDCEPQLLIHGPGHRDGAELLGLRRTWHLGAEGAGHSYEDVLDAAAPGARATERGDRAAVLMYTSGTTGRPKGVVLSGDAVWARVDSAAREVGPVATDVLLFPIPLFHASSSVAAAFTSQAATVVQARTFTTESCLALLAAHAATHAVLVPTVISRLLDRLQEHPATFAALRMIVYGGSPITPQTVTRALAVLDCELLQFYGLTEAVNASVLRPEHHGAARDGQVLASAGVDAASYELRVVDAQGVERPMGQEGEIVVQGPGVMDCYWNAPEETATALRDGWLHTGDAGFRSADGFLVVTDRLKDVIVSGGENISAREVEEVLAGHPDVAEAAVIGLPDPAWGEAAHALVVLSDGAELDGDRLLAFCRTRLAGYKVPKSVRAWDALPKNATGKVLKGELRAAFR